jgi:hypothetical protein
MGELLGKRREFDKPKKRHAELAEASLPQRYGRFCIGYVPVRRRRRPTGCWSAEINGPSRVATTGRTPTASDRQLVARERCFDKLSMTVYGLSSYI